MQCPKCHKLIDAELGYCPFCGYDTSKKNLKPGSARAFLKSGRVDFINGNDVIKEPDKKESQKQTKKIEVKNQPKRILSFHKKKKIKPKKDELIKDNIRIERVDNESERLFEFKNRHNINEIFEPYKKEIGEVENEIGITIIRLKNRTPGTFITRIEGVGNLFYEEFRLRPFQNKTVKLQNGTYSIQTYLDKFWIIWKRKITKNEIHYYSRSPIDGRFNSDNRTVTFEGGIYNLQCGSIVSLMFYGIKKLLHVL